jgi:LPS-assembly protein
VQLYDANQALLADEANYNQKTGDFEASGNISYKKNTMELYGRRASINLNSSTGEILGVDFRLNDRHTRGEARRAELQGKDLTMLKKVTYTSCNPGQNDWLLNASTVNLDRESGTGDAYNVVLSFMHVPFFYLPYISFPINDKRKSGFLTPTFSHSTTSGNELSIPYYLNLAPDTDATLTPRYYSQRGNMLAAEFRYLRPYSEGNMDLEYLPYDRLYDDWRGWFSYEHHGWTNSDLHSDIELNMVSDSQYFEQLGDSLSTSSITHLRQRAGFTYAGRDWRAGAIVQGYQTVDETIPDTSRPYRLLPQLTLTHMATQQPNEINTLFDANYTHFSRSGRPSGKRFDIRPGLAYPFNTPGTFLTPKISWYETYYQMDNAIDGQGNEFTRGLPVFSLDSGVILERLVAPQAEHPILQTLEPRLYYLYIPYRDQSQIPVFDSGLPEFTYYRLFTDNRFNGIDRIGDADQVTLAVTTRFIDNSNGRELFSASLGQIYYNKDRRVSLSGSNIETSSTSPLLALAQASITDKLSLSADLRWDGQQQKIDRGNLQVRYHPEKRKIFNLSYRYRDQVLEQSDISLLWPVASQWYLLGRWNYSQRQHQPLEGLAGLEYQSCCWALRLASRRYLSDTNGEYQNAVFLQLELKGLTSIGDSIEKLLENGILGYQK